MDGGLVTLHRGGRDDHFRGIERNETAVHQLKRLREIGFGRYAHAGKQLHPLG